MTGPKPLCALVSACVTTLTLTACQTSPPTIHTTDSACQTLEPLTYAYDGDYCGRDAENMCDTKDTVELILQHNAVLEALCRDA